MPFVIFVTAHEQYALDAFRSRALDYVLKPYHAARLQEVLDRARAMIASHSVRAPSSLERSAELAQRLELLVRAQHASGMARRVLLRVEGRHVVVREDEIDAMSASDNHVTVRLGRTALRTRCQLASMHAQVDAATFLRVHRSHVVNINRVREVQPRSRGDAVAVLRDGTRIPVSARYRDALLTRLRQRV